jgi:hypothetical protein
MSITIGPPLETELRDKANAEGITVEAYLERLLRTDREALNELKTLALEGLNSGEAVLPGPEYWADKHRRLDDRLKSAR